MSKRFTVLAAVLPILGLLASAAQTSSSKKASAPTHAAEPQVVLPTEPGTYAVIYTSMGNIVCRLFPQEAPKAVANFIGLANGTKPWTDPKTGRHMKAPLYSGTDFHRVIPGFMIQGGDPAGDGSGGPGYEFADEINPDRVFDRPGIVAMANRGKNTNGSQFFITVGPAPHLNGGYTVFGEVVSGQDVADAISNVPRNEEDKPDTEVKIKRIAIRKVAGAAKPPEQKPASRATHS